jgi:hypothetical protein
MKTTTDRQKHTHDESSVGRRRVRDLVQPVDRFLNEIESEVISRVFAVHLQHADVGDQRRDVDVRQTADLFLVGPKII